MIDASQRMIAVQCQVQGEAKEGWGINPAIERHLELEIKTLQNAPRDANKLRKLLEVKQRQKEQAVHIEDTERLVTEIEMLKVVLQKRIEAMKIITLLQTIFSIGKSCGTSRHHVYLDHISASVGWHVIVFELSKCTCPDFFRQPVVCIHQLLDNFHLHQAYSFLFADLFGNRLCFCQIYTNNRKYRMSA